MWMSRLIDTGLEQLSRLIFKMGDLAEHWELLIVKILLTFSLLFSVML